MQIPGGWCQQKVPVSGREFAITLPADPDAFLDDPATIAEHERTDYMPYWPYLWPAAEKLAALVLRSDLPVGQRVLEIGCGIGLTGLAALARGDDVTFSDYRSEAVELARRNAADNGFPETKGLVFDYREPTGERFDWILGSEVIYERSLHAPVLGLVRAMLTPGGRCWLGDAGRHTAGRFTEEARQRGFEVHLFDADGREVNDLVAGEFRLIELR